jgi:O-antigen/teichoic acid export membrane protein
MNASGILLAALLGNNVCNYVFHALASHKLGPADYGALVSMLALLTLLAIPSQTIQTVVAQHVAVEEACGARGHLTALMARLLRQVTLAGGGFVVVLCLAGPWLAKFFQLPSAGPIWAVGITTLVMFLLAVVRGWLQGMQRFGALGFNLLGDGVLRLGLGASIFALGWRVTGGILTSALAGGLAFVLALAALPRLQSGQNVRLEKKAWTPLYAYAGPVVLNLAAFMALASMDVMLVKHFFLAQAAGYYGAASMAGKAFLFVGMAMAQVLFPKASATHAQAENPYPLVWKSLGITAAVLGIGAAAAWMLAPLIIRMLFGAAFMNNETLFLMQGFGPAMTPLALVYILLQYNLAVRSTRFVWLLLADIVLLTISLWLWHVGLTQVLWVVGINHSLLFIGSLLLTPRLSLEQRRGFGGEAPQPR